MERKRAKVHMLPTDGESILHYCPWDDDVNKWMIMSSQKSNPGDHTAMALYITTDEEIKEGDWFMPYSQSQPVLCQETAKHDKGATLLNNDLEKGYSRESSRKIIATTDPKLTKCLICLDQKVRVNHKCQGLPQIPQSFIEEYCKVGGIDEVLVEFESLGDWEGQMTDRYTRQMVLSCKTCERWVAMNEKKSCKCGFKPKLNPDNTIIIHPVEEKMYSRDEVVKLGNKLLDILEIDVSDYQEWFDKWIGEI